MDRKRKGIQSVGAVTHHKHGLLQPHCSAHAQYSKLRRCSQKCLCPHLHASRYLFSCLASSQGVLCDGSLFDEKGKPLSQKPPKTESIFRCSSKQIGYHASIQGNFCLSTSEGWKGGGGATPHNMRQGRQQERAQATTCRDCMTCIICTYSHCHVCLCWCFLL
jgi:hypothetical protein